MRSRTLLTIWALVLTVLLMGCASGNQTRKADLAAGPEVSAPVPAPAADTGAPAKPASEAELDDLAGYFDGLVEQGEIASVEVPDPLAPWNRAMFYFNDRFYFLLVKPVAQAYGTVVPIDFRIVIKNFFHNLGSPHRFVAALLQGKVEAAFTELAIFAINSTVGILGMAEPATKDFGLVSADEDLGQTLAAWGFGDGPYIVWPILGPSTVRDTVGMVGGYFLDPVFWVEPWYAAWSIEAGAYLNSASLHIGDYEGLKEFSIDPYEALRNFYIQHRHRVITK